MKAPNGVTLILKKIFQSNKVFLSLITKWFHIIKIFICSFLLFTWSSDSVDVEFSVVWQVVVDDQWDLLDVDAASPHVGRDQNAGLTRSGKNKDLDLGLGFGFQI
jgi:hypothetical protein